MPDASLIACEGEDLKDSDQSWRPDRHYVASFQPQAWVNDYAVDVDAQGEQAWVVTSFIGQADVDLSQRSSMLTNNSGASDALQSDPHAPQWVRDYSGPFTVLVYAYEDAQSAQVAVDAFNGVVRPDSAPARRPGL